ncbi:MAG: hypothetical protein ACI8YQ_000911 [Polaribacter sp.]
MKNGGFSILGITTNLYADNFILMIDSLGNPTASVGVNAGAITLEKQTTDSEGNIIVSARKNLKGNSIFDPHSGIIMKFDSNLDLLWAKEFSIDHFSCDRFELSCSPNGDILFSFHTWKESR